MSGSEDSATQLYVPQGTSIESEDSDTLLYVPQGTSNPSGTNRPIRDLIAGPISVYLEKGVPLYEASIKCDWKAAEKILDANPEYVTYSITENDETTLHIAASAKGPKKVNEFVKNLMKKFPTMDLTLVNKSNYTALYLAAAAGNVEAVEFMLGKNADLLSIRGIGDTMPLYAAALFGNDKVVKYLYDKSQRLDGWPDEQKMWLLEKCVESDMFDTALKILKDIEYRDNVGRSNVLKDIVKESNVLGILARKPEAFRKKESNIIGRTIKSVSAFIRKTAETPETESKALRLLKIVWKYIVLNLNKDQINDILRGSPDSIKSDSGRIIHIARLDKHLCKLHEETQKITNKAGQVSKLRNLVSEHVEDMHAEIQTLSKECEWAFGRGDQALELQKLISMYIVKIHDETESLIIQETGNPDQAHKLHELIHERITKMHTATTKETYSYRVLFVAAEVGNTAFLVELIRQCPDLIWKRDDDNNTIFHIAVKHRHEGIYNLLYEIGAMKDMITLIKDRQDNNMLHLVGKSVKEKRLEDVSGVVALQMQRQLLWFQEVKNMIPPSYRERKNKDDLTPHELFTKEHKELVSQGEKWMKRTASQCMVVATLIATIVFAAAFTVPGGYTQSDDHKENGLAVFHSKANFVVFVMADAISLFASSGSIFIFLSILTSRYAERDFLESIPNQLIAGLATLFISIATMMLAFSVSFFVLYQQGFLWIPILIAVFAVLPVILYLVLHYGLFFDIIRSTYGSRYLFKPKKHVLYYENPKV